MDYKHVLLAIPNEELSKAIESWLYQIPSGDEFIVVDPVRNEFDARKRLMAQRDNPYHLLIVHIGLALNRNSPVNDKDQIGLEMLKALQFRIPSILLTPSVTKNLFYTTTELHKCMPIEEGLTMQEQLIKYAKGYLFATTKMPSEERVRITFKLDKDKSEYTIDGLGGFSFHDENSIDISSDLMKSLLRDSRSARTVTEYPDWEDHLRGIGELLTKRLFLDSYPMARSYWKVAGKRKIEICFDVARSVHPVILESLIEPDSYFSSPHFWMLEAPIYRKLRNETPTDRRALFQGPREKQPNINCLIIESTAGGLAPEVNAASGGPLELNDLPSAAKEAESLESYLQEKRKDFRLGEILRIRPSDLNGESFRTKVHRELTREDMSWHLVHYAGHCHYDDRNKKGHVFFPGAGFIEAVDLATFSVWLSRTQFVYLSACRSSEEQVVFELANNHVPSAIGFRWEIEDDAAAVYTSLFYKTLFEVHRSLEYAFLETRRSMSTHEKYAKKRIWAAPMLIMQLNESAAAV